MLGRKRDVIGGVLAFVFFVLLFERCVPHHAVAADVHHAHADGPALDAACPLCDLQAQLFDHGPQVRLAVCEQERTPAIHFPLNPAAEGYRLRLLLRGPPTA